MTDGERGHSGSLQQHHVSLGAGVGFSYRSWSRSLRGRSSRTAKLKQLQRAGRTSSRPPYPSKFCAYARISPPSSRYPLRLPQRTDGAPRRTPQLSSRSCCFLNRKPARAALCSLFLFQSHCALLDREGRKKKKRSSKQLPSKSNKQEVVESEAFRAEVLHLRALPSLAGGAASEERAVRSWRRRCAPLRHPLPLAANSFSPCLMLVVCGGGGT